MGDRKRALEEEFFRQRERALLERLRGEHARQTARQALASASGISDDVVLTRLVELGIEPDTLLALRLVPLIEVAWADGRLDDRERQAVLSGLETAGLKPGSAAYAIVQGWLASPPPASVLDAWTSYTSALCARLAPGERANLRASVMGQARAVAEAAGGFLGVGRISQAEEEMLRRLEQAFGA
jgi:hypothetical protein